MSTLTAYITGHTEGMPIQTAPIQRAWMDATGERFAYRCLPLVIANQHGWVIPSPCAFTATWVNDGFAGVAIDWQGGPLDARISSHFGCGILTFSIPYLFRTDPGVNLWFRGPANMPKDGACPLEGIVETDWLPATATMNWKLTRLGQPVAFAKGEPICMLTPVQRALVEAIEPKMLPIAADPELHAEYQAWDQSRRQFNADLKRPGSEAVRQRWQRDYFKGQMATGAASRDHQTKLRLKEF
jgi:hypothetical protein